MFELEDADVFLLKQPPVTDLDVDTQTKSCFPHSEFQIIMVGDSLTYYFIMCQLSLSYFYANTQSWS